MGPILQLSPLKPPLHYRMLRGGLGLSHRRLVVSLVAFLAQLSVPFLMFLTLLHTFAACIM